MAKQLYPDQFSGGNDYLGTTNAGNVLFVCPQSTSMSEKSGAT